MSLRNPEQLLGAGQPGRLLQSLQQQAGDVIEEHEFHLVPPVAVDQQMGRIGRRLRGLVVRSDQVHRVAIAQRPGQGREHWPAGQQIAVGIGGDLVQFARIQRQRQFDPLVVRQFEQEWAGRPSRPLRSWR